MRFLLSVWHDDDYTIDVTSEDMQRIGAKVGALNAELDAAGAMVFGGGLLPAPTATVCKVDDHDDVLTTNGPYATTAPQMGGFWIIDTPDHPTALDWARKAAVATEGPVELRPFQPD